MASDNEKNSFGHGNTTTSWEVSSIEQKNMLFIVEIPQNEF